MRSPSTGLPSLPFSGISPSSFSLPLLLLLLSLRISVIFLPSFPHIRLTRFLSLSSFMTRRSLPFELLPRNSPGDGDLFSSPTDGGDSTRSGNPKRRRKHKNRKSCVLRVSAQTETELGTSIDREVPEDTCSNCNTSAVSRPGEQKCLEEWDAFNGTQREPIDRGNSDVFLKLDSNGTLDNICRSDSMLNGIMDLDDKDEIPSQHCVITNLTVGVSPINNIFSQSSSESYNVTYKARESPGPGLLMESPIDYFLGEVRWSSSASQDFHSVENDKKRQHVYNTMFHVPWRCELLIVVGFFVCLDSFLSLLTIMPTRICIFVWKLVSNKMRFRRLRANELADLGSLLVLVAGVSLLQQTDISYIYHMIRSQATIKLYVVYNVLEIFDRLCQSFGSDVFQVLLNSADNVANCSPTDLLSETLRFTLDQCIAVFAFVVHSFIILAQSITVSAALRSHNNALLTLLISNNFAEIKSNVFKRFTKDNLHRLAYLDTVERFHIIAHLLFVLAQNLLAANEPWLLAFAWNAGMVLLCEILVDVIKHAFLAKFNDIKPSAYTEFLLSLCEQIKSSQSHEVHKTISFVPFAPACVVIRVLIPLYAAYLPATILWRFLCMLIYGVMTYCLLVALKISIALVLRKHASCYVARYGDKKKRSHLD